MEQRKRSAQVGPKIRAELKLETAPAQVTKI